MLTVPGVSEGETACGVVSPPWFSLGFLWVSLQGLRHASVWAVLMLFSHSVMSACCM